jgi:branched-chain amino acid transport system permease protein
MAFFLETLLGGLMSGMLYSLVALGFVLIFKASGVFNFAQGAMVLFAALAMARFSEWIPGWLGMENLFVANLLAFAVAVVIMFVVAWLIERPWPALPGQPGRRDAADGHARHRLRARRRRPDHLRSDIYKIDVGMPKEPVMMLESVFEGGILINKEDFIAALIAALLVISLSIFFQKTATGRALRAVADDHQAAQSIGIPLDRIWVIVWCVAGITALVAGIIWGSKTRRAVLLVDHCLARLAGSDPRRADLGPGRHHWRPDHRCRRETFRGLSWALCGWRHRDLVCLHAGAGLPPVQAARPVRRENH